MSYRDLPPGRGRMLAYANEVDTRNRIVNMRTSDAVASVLNNIYTSNTWNRSRDLTFGTIRVNPNRLNNLQISPFYEYEVLADLPNVKVGLISKDLLDKSKIKESKEMSFCTICQHDIFLDIVRTLECSHTFHVNCIDRWFTENKKCPQCRFEI